MTSLYKIKIRKNNLEVEIESNEKDFVNEKLQEFFSEKAASADREFEDISKQIKPGDKRLSLQEFISKINPNGGPQHVLCIAYYKEYFEGMTQLYSKDIDSGFQTVRFKSSNVSRDIAQARDQSFIMDGPAAKSFVITNTGKKWVDVKLANE